MKRVVGMFVIIALVVIAGLGSFFFTTCNDHTYTATVTDKERIVDTDDEGNVESYYLIFCKDDEGNYHEFQNYDEVLRGKFNSSTVYNQIEVGETYKFTVVGFRFPLLSLYENIIKIEKVN